MKNRPAIPFMYTHLCTGKCGRIRRIHTSNEFGCTFLAIIGRTMLRLVCDGVLN